MENARRNASLLVRRTKLGLPIVINVSRVLLAIGLIRLGESTTILERKSKIQGVPVISVDDDSRLCKNALETRLAELSTRGSNGLSLQSAGGLTSNHDAFISFLR